MQRVSFIHNLLDPRLFSSPLGFLLFLAVDSNSQARRPSSSSSFFPSPHPLPLVAVRADLYLRLKRKRGNLCIPSQTFVRSCLQVSQAMDPEKSASRFIETGVLQPPSPTTDSATLKKLEAGDHAPHVTHKSPEWQVRRSPPSRSAHSSYSGTPAAMQIPDAAASDLPVVSFLFPLHELCFILSVLNKTHHNVLSNTLLS